MSRESSVEEVCADFEGSLVRSSHYSDLIQRIFDRSFLGWNGQDGKGRE
jgi:hypothetical protein